MDKNIEPTLAEQSTERLRDPRLAATIVAHCHYLSGDVRPDAVSTAIHPECQMLAHSLRHHQDASLAVSQYFNVALQQYHTAQQITGMFFPDGLGHRRFLDFACGYGRLLRFLVHSMPPDNIWAAEIQPDAVDYVRDQFGVHTVLTTAEPEEFQPQQRFDVIWVASLFSHLPEPLFHRWLKRLTECLTPEGILCFSTHDETLLPGTIPMPETGILYGEGSENADLDPSIYGTTYVSEAFVSRSIRQIMGDHHPYYRLPRTLAHEQDIYVVAYSPDRDLSVLDGFRRGPWGWVDERAIDASGLLTMHGWAASLDDGALNQLEVRIDGDLQHCPTGELRQDVADAFKDDRLAPSGWTFSYALDRSQEEPYIEVTARTQFNETALLFAGVMPNPAAEPPQDGLLARLRRALHIG